MQTLKTLLYGLWNITVFLFMLMAVACRVVIFVAVDLPVRIYRHAKS